MQIHFAGMFFCSGSYIQARDVYQFKNNVKSANFVGTGGSYVKLDMHDGTWYIKQNGIQGNISDIGRMRCWEVDSAASKNVCRDRP